MGLKQTIWKCGYARWPSRRGQPQTGYTALLPVPGDLPVFTALALRTFQQQDRRHCNEVFVIPDVPSAEFRSTFQALRAGCGVEAELCEMGHKARMFGKWSKGNPHAYHFLQLFEGITRARSEYVLFHDADLFIQDPTFLRSYFEKCMSERAGVFGVSPVWDSWYAENGYLHLVATWEMLASTDWLRRFPPHLHHGHEGVIDGKRHRFDTALYPQCLTDPREIKLLAGAPDFVHFNYVICTYRKFLVHGGSAGPFEDEHFRLLLIRLLIDAFDRTGHAYAVPSLAELTDAVHGRSDRVGYSDPQTRSHYPEFRGKLSALLGSSYFDPESRKACEAAIALFDQVMQWQGERLAV